MSVVNGQIANQTTFNNAFMSRTAATTQTTAKVALENADLGDSGAIITNAQKAINKAFEGVGATGESDTTINDYANQNYITNGDDRKVAVGKLDAQLKLTQDDLDTAELAIADLELDVADHETRIDDLETDVGVLQSDVADHETRITDLESNDMTIGGNKTFSGDVVVQGNFEVQGTLTSVNSTNLEVEDQNILVNKNGTDMSAEGAGVDVERPSGNAGIRFDSALASKFKIGLLTNLYEVLVSGVAQSISGLKDFLSGIKVDTIDESTSNIGVTVDGVLIKDGLVDGRNVATDGTTLDGHDLTLIDHESRIDDLETDVGLLQTDVTDLQTDVSDHETRITDIESNASTFGGNKTFSNDVEVQGATVVKNIEINEDLFVDSVANVQTGSDVQLTGITAPLIRLTGVGLGSVDRIEAPLKTKIIALLNQTGGAIVIKDNVGSPSTDRIRTGTGADATLQNNGIAFLAYDIVAGLWFITSLAGAGGGGGGGGSKTFEMKLNGLYGGSAAYNNVDGLWVAPVACQITNVFIYQDVAGSGGTTNLDLKIKPFLSGAFTSIFLTTPKVTNLGGANQWCGVGDTNTGFTAPILTSLPFAVAAKSAIRMDLLGSQAGSAAGVGLIIVYEEI